MRTYFQDSSVKIVHIKRMTLDLFQFWLDYDWWKISSRIPLLSLSEKISSVGHAPYRRSIRVLWGPETPTESTEGYSSYIAWAQIYTDEIRVEFTNNGEFSTEIAEWLKRRFSADIPIEAEATITDSEPEELTPTETKVAGWLADGLDYEQIAVRLGGRTEGAAKKHGQNLSKKWNTRQYVELLQGEAKKRGYKAP